MAKYPCRNCVYFENCGDNMRQMPCMGRTTKSQRKAFEREMCDYAEKATHNGDINLPDVIELGDVQEWAEMYMKPEEIDHHYSDLYLKLTSVSKAIVSRLKYTSLLEKFISNIDGSVWYDLPFCYHA